jgi:hypothetical protein
LLTDGYDAFDSVAKARNLVRAGCLAHARRYFKDVIKVQPEASRRAHIALDYIGKLYEIERELPSCANGRLSRRPMSGLMCCS